MDLQAKKLHFIQEILSITNEKTLEKLENLLDKERSEQLDPILKEKLSSRALKAERDISEGQIKSREQIEKELDSRFGQ